MPRLRALFVCIPYLDLEVAGANQPGGAGPWVATYTGNLGDAVTIRAHTVIGSPPVAWAVAPVGVVSNNLGNDRIAIPLDNPLNVLPAGQTIAVTAAVNGLQQTIHIIIQPQLQALGVVADHYAFMAGGGAWYAYDLTGLGVPGNPSANLQIQTLPNTAAAWQHVGWGARVPPAGPVVNLVPVNGNTQSLVLNAAQQVRVTALVNGLPAQNRDIDIRAPRNWGALANNLQVALDRFIFAGGFAVIQESAVNFNAPASHRWIRNQIPTRPQAFDAGAAVTLQHVTLNVTHAPAALTAVTIRATAYLSHADGHLSTLQGQVNGNIPMGHAGNIDLGNIVLVNLPNEVMLNDPLLIFWEVNTGGAWTLIEVSQNTVYVTAQAPVATTEAPLNSPAGPVYTYHSLLDMSCRAANGQAGGVGNQIAVRDAIYGFFNPANPNNNVQRLTPGAASVLRYWDNWGNLPAPAIAQSLNGAAPNLFNVANGNIACGVWAEMLIAMWAMHGIGTGRIIGVHSSRPGLTAPPPGGYGLPAFPGGFPNLPNIVAQTRFLVRNWDYNNHVALANNNYTHSIINMLPFGPGNEAMEAIGVFGQNNPNPPPQFDNHYIVRDGVAGDFFDPSYGTPHGNRNAWLDASLVGLRNDSVNPSTVGFVQVNVLAGNRIDTNQNAVALFDFVTQAWIP